MIAKAKRLWVWCSGGRTILDWVYPNSYPYNQKTIKSGRCKVCGKHFRLSQARGHDNVKIAVIPSHKTWIKEKKDEYCSGST